MAKRRRGGVAIEEKRELETSVPVGMPDDDDGPDFIEQEPVVTKQPLVYLRHPQLRDAWVEILALRALGEIVPEHLSINDNLVFTNASLARRVRDRVAVEGVELDVKNARRVADEMIPRP